LYTDFGQRGGGNRVPFRPREIKALRCQFHQFRRLRHRRLLFDLDDADRRLIR